MEEVRRLRLAKGWNQTKLAYHADLAPSVISLLETGKREPNATTLRKLADALEVEIPDLFKRPASPKAPSRSSNEPPEESKEERLLIRLCNRLIADLKADTDRWESAARTGSIGRDGLQEIIARRASIQRSLNSLDEVSEALGVDVSGRRGTPLRDPKRDLEGAFNRWRSAWEEMVESHTRTVLEGDEQEMQPVLHKEVAEPVKSRWLDDVA